MFIIYCLCQYNNSNKKQYLYKSPFFGGNMNTVRYYRIINSALLDENNYCDMSDTFIVNCTGYENRTDKFECFKPHGRKDNYFLYIQDGKITVITDDDRKITLSKGQGIFFEAGKRHWYEAQESPVTYYWAHFTGSHAESTLRRFGFSHNFVFNIGENASIVHCFHKMFDEFTIRYADFTYNASLYMLQIFVEIKRHILNSINAPAIRFKKSLIYINNHYNSDISIRELAEIEGVCISRYRDLFTRQMGISPKQYITHLRISNSCSLLESTRLSIEEISEKCGYSDIRYFYRVFKTVNGITPHQFRKTHNKS